MNALKLSVPLLLLSLPFNSIAREESYLYPNGAMKIFIEPLALIDIYNRSCIRIGGEFPVYGHFSGFAVGGVYADGKYAKAGIKFYGLSKKVPDLFFSLSVFYKKEGYNVNDNLKTLGSDPGAGFSYYVNKDARGISFEVGEVAGGKHFAFEWYAGVGFRIKNVIPSISDSAQNGLYHISESIIQGFTNSSTRNGLYPSITLGIRFGYIYKKGTIEV